MKISFKSQKGGMETLILIMIVAAAFVFVGGQSAFDMIYPDEDVTPTPTPAPAAGANSQWSIDLINKSCDAANNLSNVSIGFHGPDKGYYEILVDGTSIQTNEYIPSSLGSESITLPLPDNLGFNIKPWKLRLFSGGSQTGSGFSGGTQKAEKQFDPTNCQ